MSSSFSGNPNNALPQTYIIPEDTQEKDLKLAQYLNSIATATNSKDSGLYNAVETITGQQFLPIFTTQGGSNVNYRGVFRKVIDFGALPNAASKSVAHGIPIGASYSITRLYGASTQPNTSFIPLPFASPVLNQNISLTMNGTNIIITTGINRTAYTRTYVIIEYIKVV
jgi:hypothetical protein